MPFSAPSPARRRWCVEGAQRVSSSFPPPLCRGLPGNRSGIDHGPVACDGLEPERFPVNVNQQKQLLLIVGGRGCLRSPDTALAQLSPRADDEIGDPFLRLEPFIHVVVSGKHNLDAVAQEQWLEPYAELDVRPMPFAVRVDRMVEVRDLPELTRRAQRLLEPFELLRVEHVRIDGEEPYVVAREAEVPLAVHVPARIGD